MRPLGLAAACLGHVVDERAPRQNDWAAIVKPRIDPTPIALRRALRLALALGVSGSATVRAQQAFEVTIDATGSNKSMANALQYCGFTGRLVYVGITQAEVSFPHAPMMQRNRTLRAIGRRGRRAVRRT